MRSTRSVLIIGILGLLGLSAPSLLRGQQSNAPPPARPSGAPQQAQPNQNRNPRIIVPTYTVIVPVTVKDNHGQLVGDLTKNDFRIFADGVEQKIGNFSADPVPISAVILIDNDLPDRAVSQVQKSLVAIAAGFGPSDEAALVTYEQFPETVSDFSSDNDQLITQLQRLELGSHSNATIVDPTTTGPVANGQPLPTATGLPQHGSGRYKENAALNDALYASAQMLKGRGRNRRKIVFLISDGADKSNTHPFDDTLQALLSSDVSVYSISVTHSLPVGRRFLQHGTSEIDQFALDTAGDTFYAAKQSDLERLYSDVTEQARNQYTLTFSPQGVPAGKDYHEIEVRVERPGLSIETRKGYYQSAIVASR